MVFELKSGTYSICGIIVLTSSIVFNLCIAQRAPHTLDPTPLPLYTKSNTYTVGNSCVFAWT